MMNNIFKIFLVFLWVFLASCAINPVTGRQELMLVSEPQEVEIGKQAAPSANWEFGGTYNDPALTSYLEDIVRRIWQNSQRPNLPFKFHIQNTSIPNAFALPGYVAITRGLLSDMENEAQFAYVMGHEIGHVMARHTAQRVSRMNLQQLGLAFGGAALGGTRSSDALLNIGAMVSSLYLLKFDRGQELEADKLGVRYAALIGYDPHEALRAHEILEQSADKYLNRLGKSKGEDNFLSDILSTHPRTSVRLAEIHGMIDQLPPYKISGDGKSGRRFQDELRNIRDINAVYFIYDEAENFYKKSNFKSAEDRVRKALTLNNRQAPFHNLLGLINIQQKNYSAAQDSFAQALSINAGYQPAVYGTGLIYMLRGDYNSAINKFKMSLSLYPEHPASNLAIGRSYFSINRYKEAIPHLDYFEGIAPNHPEIHGLLGICYENTGALETAVREYSYKRCYRRTFCKNNQCA
ncbi:MAG: M48 family metalloprotease [Nitrospirae bacterium]|nr:M48 family metalloprotease [Nitrospirota bacterium]